MDEDRHSLFEKLLQQLGLSQWADQENFKTATLERLTVHEKSRRWHFYLQFPQILPYETFVTFHQKLQVAFHDIATVSASFITTDAQLTNRALGDYWLWVVQNSGLTNNLV